MVDPWVLLVKASREDYRASPCGVYPGSGSRPRGAGATPMAGTCAGLDVGAFVDEVAAADFDLARLDRDLGHAGLDCSPGDGGGNARRHLEVDAVRNDVIGRELVIGDEFGDGMGRRDLHLIVDFPGT